MEFVRDILTEVNLQEDTLYEIIYDLFFFKALAESQENIEKGEVCTLEELKKEMEAIYESYYNK